MWILIDDERELNCDITCRTIEAGIAVLEHFKGNFNTLCIDHDLGEHGAKKEGFRDGYDIIKWAAENSLLPPRVQIVSSNPVGVSNIAAVLKDHDYSTKDGRNYTKVVDFADPK